MGYARKLANMQLGQREDWPAIRESQKGRMYVRHLAKIVTLKVRFGNRIYLNQLSLIPETPLEQRLLLRIEGLIAQQIEVTGKASSRKLERLLAAEKVLRITQTLRQNNGGRPPTVFQVLGSTALLYGTNSEELKQTASNMNTIYRDNRESVTWVGSLSGITKAVHHIPIAHLNYISAIDKILFDHSKPLNSRDIVKQLHHRFSETQSNIVNYALQLLDTMGLVKKLPVVVDFGNHGQLSVWMNSEFKPPLAFYLFDDEKRMHYKNTNMEVLSLLELGPELIIKLYRPDGNNLGNPNAIYPQRTISRASNRLKALGLISVNQEKIKTRGSRTERLELTALGKQLWDQAKITGILPPELIKLLLGKREGYQTEQNQAEDLLRTT